MVASSKPENEVESVFFLDVVVGEASTVFKLLASEDESLRVSWDSFFVVDLCLEAFNAVALFDINGHGFSCESSDEDLHVF